MSWVNLHQVLTRREVRDSKAQQDQDRDAAAFTPAGLTPRRRRLSLPASAWDVQPGSAAGADASAAPAGASGRDSMDAMEHGPPEKEAAFKQSAAAGSRSMRLLLGASFRQLTQRAASTQHDAEAALATSPAPVTGAHGPGPHRTRCTASRGWVSRVPPADMQARMWA